VTDSQIVLGYSNNDIRKFRVYAANRVQMIRYLSEVHQWHYVSTKDNPADHASRKLHVKDQLVLRTSFPVAAGSTHHAVT
jgi:hypothetical protein